MLPQGLQVKRLIDPRARVKCISECSRVKVWGFNFFLIAGVVFRICMECLRLVGQDWLFCNTSDLKFCLSGTDFLHKPTVWCGVAAANPDT